MLPRRRVIQLSIAAVVVIVLAIFLWPRGYCRSAKRRYGIEVATCPAGKPRQQLAIRSHDLRRGGAGTVYVSSKALYAVEDDAGWSDASVLELEASLSLVDPAGKETPLAVEPKPGWFWTGNERAATVKLPAMPDGDYVVRAKVKTGIGTDTVDLPVPLYAPARIHVITDRPLYQPGNVVSFRALALRANDLSPIDRRPGSWIVRSPSGQVMLEEKAPAGEWGVVAGDFPLDRQAEVGTWKVTWRSGRDEQTRDFRVEPFSLPRFRIEAAADRPFYGARDAPVVRGAVVYSSGAPVARAQVELQWRVVSDGWPAPTAWPMAGQPGSLPTRAQTGANGRFELQLPPVPADLQGQARLMASLAAIDAAGDRVGGAVEVLLSQDPIKVQAITELAGGLVAGFNNRVYLRVTTADGRPLPGSDIQVKRAWAGADPGIATTLDEDAVARLQIDPGPPVNVVIPGRPVRSPPPAPAVQRSEATDAITQEPVRLDDLTALDGWNAALAPCAKWVNGDDGAARVLLDIDEGGGVAAADVVDDPRSRCVLGVVRSRRLPAGPRRLVTLAYQFDDAALASIEVEKEAPLGELDLAVVDEAMLDARDCVPPGFDGEVPWTMTWQVVPGARQLRTRWNREGGDMPAALATCLEQRIARHPLAVTPTIGRVGLLRFTIDGAAGADGDAPAAQPTIMQGYELLVSVQAAGRSLGETRLRMSPGTVPPLRLRATPVLPKPGETVKLELVRGPDYEGEVPAEVAMVHLGKTEPLKVAKDRTATMTLPVDARGWYELTAGPARALVYVRGGEELAVTVVPDQKAYPPGAQARLGIHTSVGGKGARAAVGLFGVDDSLSQLVPLPGADDLRSVRPEVGMTEPAFGVLDAQALTLGRIRGASAAEATVLRVSSIPSPADLDVAVTTQAAQTVDPLAELTDRFYGILGELHAQVRAWEKTAPEAELMKPETMAKLWGQALTAAKKKKIATEDAFGRTLRLRLLPAELLALTDPRQVVVVGTRLPEDVENWSAWVARRKP